MLDFSGDSGIGVSLGVNLQRVEPAEGGPNNVESPSRKINIRSPGRCLP